MDSSRQADPVFDDRTTKARIRDAAVECFAAEGIPATTVRKVAATSGVSPGLVIHHFGSMEGLRSECDEYVAATIRRYKQEALSVGPNLDVLAALRGEQTGSLMGYLAAALADDSPAVGRLVDELAADAEGYLKQGVASGMVRPSSDLKGRAAVLLLWSLGALVLHRHVHRILGVDLTAPDVATDPSFASYAGPAYGIMSDGIFTEEFAAQLQMAFQPAPDDSEPGDDADTTRADTEQPAPPEQVANTSQPDSRGTT